MSDLSSVGVVLRIRPLVENEYAKGCQDILEILPQIEQVRIKNTDKAFTFNYVLGSTSSQEELYTRCVQNLISKLFQGYHVTILAYGQTGSGKTYSMGTCWESDNQHSGVLPRAIRDIFKNIKEPSIYDFTVTVSFIEVYQEILYDLLASKPRDQAILDIREDASKGIIIQGITEIQVDNCADVMKYLRMGSLGRTTSSTSMNSVSSRSHAIFTITVTMQNRQNLIDQKTAKFSLVDLAGSERCKKTGAIGTTFKEGVQINMGLHVLGNVISSLGDEKQAFINYRDSNLTRLLKDSLGGNSITLMIACVSPADYNMEETLSTLRFANRVKKIKNKPIINQDSKIAEILELRKTVEKLKLQIVNQGGPVLCSQEIQSLKRQLSETNAEINNLTFQMARIFDEHNNLQEQVLIYQRFHYNLSEKLADLKTAIASQNIIRSDDLKKVEQPVSEMENEFSKMKAELKSHNSFVMERVRDSRKMKAIPKENEIFERQASYVHKQLQLKSQLDDIIDRLALKEQLISHLQENIQSTVINQSLLETKNRISDCQIEIKGLRKNMASSSKTTAQMEKIKQLESTIQQLTEQNEKQHKFMESHTEKKERISVLRKEILNLLKEKEELLNQMRAEGCKYRLWREKREDVITECIDYKEHPDEVEAMNINIRNIKNQKLKHTADLNEKLKNAMDLLNQHSEKSIDNVIQEIDLYVDSVRAEAALSDLLESRSKLQKQLDNLKTDPDKTEDENIQILENDIKIHSLRIQEIQKTIVDFKDAKGNMWENIASLPEAIGRLNALWIRTAENIWEISELQSKVSELKIMLDVFKEENKALKKNHADKIEQLEIEYTENIAVLLEQLQDKPINTEDKLLEKTIKLQFQHANLLKALNKNLEEQIEELNKKLCKHELNANQVRHEVLEKQSMFSDRNDSQTSFSNKLKRKFFFGPGEKDESHNDTELNFDWKKTTMGQRILQEQEALQAHMKEFESFKVERPVKDATQPIEGSKDENKENDQSTESKKLRLNIRTKSKRRPLFHLPC